MPAPYPDELKRRAVTQVRTSGRPVAAVARELGVSSSALRSWLKRAANDQASSPNRAGADEPSSSSSTAAPLLVADSIAFSYGRRQVLFDISLTVRAGELLALLGTNGAGKSTLLRVICGLEPPGAGTVWFDGRDVSGVPAEELVSHGLCLVQGDRGVFADMTVAENLEIGAYALRRRDPARWRERREVALATFPRLGERLRQRANSLSGGEQQQLALARAILFEPRLLCIDELSLGLAPVVLDVLVDAVRAINQRGTTVVLVEQSLNVATSLCARAVFLEKGEVRFEGPTTELLERDDIARAVFFGDAVGAR